MVKEKNTWYTIFGATIFFCILATLSNVGMWYTEAKLDRSIKELNEQMKAFSDTVKIDSVKTKESSQLFDYNEYEKVIKYIKEHEGFRDSVYVCPGGENTIGYGHVIKPSESYTKITTGVASGLLEADYSKAVVYVYNELGITGNKLLSISHFVFARGIGTFESSTLKQAIVNNEPIKKHIIKYCYYYNTNNVKIYNKKMFNNRMWECKLYNSKDGLYN